MSIFESEKILRNSYTVGISSETVAKAESVRELLYCTAPSPLVAPCLLSLLAPLSVTVWGRESLPFLQASVVSIVTKTLTCESEKPQLLSPTLLSLASPTTPILGFSVLFCTPHPPGGTKYTFDLSLHTKTGGLAWREKPWPPSRSLRGSFSTVAEANRALHSVLYLRSGREKTDNETAIVDTLSVSLSLQVEQDGRETEPQEVSVSLPIVDVANKVRTSEKLFLHGLSLCSLPTLSPSLSLSGSPCFFSFLPR